MARDPLRLKAVRQMLLVDVPADLERDGRAHLIQFARADIAKITAEQVARSGIEPVTTVYANNPGNRAIESVKLPGPIVAKWDYRREIAIVALSALRRQSPVQSGEYKNAHFIMLNGARVATLPANLSTTDVITIANPVPYARRIEIGKTKEGRDFVLQVDPRIYERVAKGELVPRYRNVAKITFTYVDLPGAATTKGKLSSHYKTATGKLRKRHQRPAPLRSPAIEIRNIEL